VELEEITNRPYIVDEEGFVTLPLVGQVQAAGLTVERFEAALIDLLKQYVRQPQLTVVVTQFSSDPVFFVGAFNAPGIYPLTGKRTLVEMLSSIGGLSPTASKRLRVTRRIEQGRIPLPNAVDTPDGKGTTVEINLQVLYSTVNPAEDITLQPFDVVSAERAEVVYVTGAVIKEGGIPLEERETLTVLKALALSGGAQPNAKLKQGKVLRQVMDSSRRAEIPVNLNDIREGRANDFPLMANDILFLPRGKGVGWQGVLGLSSVAVAIVSAVIFANVNRNN
jgi:polysaccharide export outer membrane protein